MTEIGVQLPEIGVQLRPKPVFNFARNRCSTSSEKPTRGSGAVESAIRRVINLRIKGASIYWLPESVDAILLLRSFYKSGRWNCLQRMAMTPVGVSA